MKSLKTLSVSGDLKLVTLLTMSTKFITITGNKLYTNIS